MTEPARTAELLAMVQEDLRPVRPLQPPVWRALSLAPLGIALLIGAPLLWGWRANFSLLNAWDTWGLSALQCAAGLAVVAAGLREAVPGRTLSRSALLGTLAAAVVTMLTVTLVSHRALPTVEPAGVWLRYARECFDMALVTGIPALALAVWLVARALPARPGVAGAICGLGIGLMMDAGVRLFCWVSSPAHVIVAHGGAIAALVVAGAVGSVIAEDRRRRVT